MRVDLNALQKIPVILRHDVPYRMFVLFIASLLVDVAIIPYSSGHLVAFTSKQIRQSDNRLEHAAVLCPRQSVRGDKGQVYRLARTALEPERLATRPKLFIILAINREQAFAELHFAEIDDAIITVNQQVYLYTRALSRGTAPCADSADDARNAQCPLQIVRMLETKSLKSQTRPCPVQR